jgi:glycerol-3-phosphate dehydrogenase (NAD(P)+)
MPKKIIAFLGCGSWGGALGDLLSKKGYNIQFWHRNSDTCHEMEISRKHYLLPSIVFGKNVTFHSDINFAIDGAKYIILAVPSQGMRSVVCRMKNSLNHESYIVNLSKGIENETLKTMSEVVSEIVGDIPNFVTLSGPSHAEEVVKQKPTAIVSASNNILAAKEIQNLFFNKQASCIYKSRFDWC